MDDRKIENIVNGKTIALLINIAVLGLAIFLLNEEKKGLTGEKTLDGETTHDLLLVSRIVSLGIILYFLYVNYELYQEFIQNPNYSKKNVFDQKLQLWSNVFILVSICLEFYIVLTNEPNSEIDETIAT